MATGTWVRSNSRISSSVAASLKIAAAGLTRARAEDEQCILLGLRDLVDHVLGQAAAGVDHELAYLAGVAAECELDVGDPAEQARDADAERGTAQAQDGERDLRHRPAPARSMRRRRSSSRNRRS